MTLESLAQLVKEMRDAQYHYFEMRRPVDLAAAKGLEKRVDDAVRIVLSPRPSLFDNQCGDGEES